MLYRGAVAGSVLLAFAFCGLLALLNRVHAERVRPDGRPVTVEIRYGDGSGEYRTFAGRPGLVQPDINGAPALLLVGREAASGQYAVLKVARVILWDPDGAIVEVDP